MFFQILNRRFWYFEEGEMVRNRCVFFSCFKKGCDILMLCDKDDFEDPEGNWHLVLGTAAGALVVVLII